MSSILNSSESISANINPIITIGKEIKTEIPVCKFISVYEPYVYKKYLRVKDMKGEIQDIPFEQIDKICFNAVSFDKSKNKTYIYDFCLYDIYCLESITNNLDFRISYENRNKEIVAEAKIIGELNGYVPYASIYSVTIIENNRFKGVI